MSFDPSILIVRPGSFARRRSECLIVAILDLSGRWPPTSALCAALVLVLDALSRIAAPPYGAVRKWKVWSGYSAAKPSSA